MRLAAVLLPLAMALPAMADPVSSSERHLEAPARTPSLLSGACSYTTAMFARRVLDEGDGWAFTGHLTPVEAPLATHVGAPYSVGPREEVRVVATEMLDSIVNDELTDKRLDLRGKRLQVEDVSYFVLTSVSLADTAR